MPKSPFGPRVIISAPFTGDIFSYVAALLVDDKTVGLYIRDENIPAVCDELLTFIKDSLGNERFSSQIYIFNSREENAFSVYGRMYREQKALKRVLRGEMDKGALNASQLRLFQVLETARNESGQCINLTAFNVISPVDICQKIVGGSPRAVHEIMQGAWTSQGDDVTSELNQWLMQHSHLPAVKSDRPIVVLWSRFSAKKKFGFFKDQPAFDTSYTGLRQLVAMANELGAYVILAGDAGYSEEKVQKHANDFLADDYPHIILDMREVWKDKDFMRLCQDFPDVNPRIMQFQLMMCIQDYYQTTPIHFGARSGNLEAYALIGQPALYFSVKAIEKGVKRVTSLESTGYMVVPISEPPTRVGKLSITTGLAIEKLSERNEAYKEQKTGVSKGFSADDLAIIKASLQERLPHNKPEGEDLDPALLQPKGRS